MSSLNLKVTIFSSLLNGFVSILNNNYIHYIKF